MNDTPETNAARKSSGLRGIAYGFGVNPDLSVAQKVIRDAADKIEELERERNDLRKAVNGLCEHIGVSPANTTLLAVQVLRIERERDEWKAEAERWRDMYMQFDEMLESDIKDATEKVSDIIAQVEKLSKEIDKGY